MEKEKIPLVRGFIRGFVISLLTTIPKNWVAGLIGGTFNLLTDFKDKKIKTVGNGVKSFLNGWNKGVISGAVGRLFSMFFPKTSANGKYLVSTFTYLGLGDVLTW